MRHGLEGINLYNPIEGKLDKIIDYYVDFYGEKYRDRIKDRLENSVFIFSDTLDLQSTPVKQYFEYANNMMIEAFEQALNNAGIAIKFGSEDIAGQMQIMTSLAGKGLNDLNAKDIEFLKQFKALANKDLTCFFDDKAKKDEYLNKFQIIDDIFKTGYDEFIEGCKRDSQKLDYVDSEALKKNELNYKTRCIKLFARAISKNLKIPTSEENLKIIAKYTPYIIKYLSKERVDVNIFKGLLKLSDRYKNAHVDNILEIFDMCKRSWQKYQDEKNFQDYIVKADIGDKLSFIKNKLYLGDEKVESIKDFILLKDTKIKGFTVVGSEIDNPDKVACVVVNRSYLFLYDDVAVHEMNHAIMTNSKYKDGILQQKIGLHKYDINLIENETQFYNGFYVGLNEVINEYISQKVVKKMHEDNFRIGYLRDTDVIYRSTFPLVGEFIEENMDAIVDICMSEDINVIDKYFVREDFDDLAMIIKELLDKFIYAERNSFQSMQNEIKTYAKSLNHDIFQLATNRDENWSNLTNDYLDFATKIKAVIDKLNQHKLDLDDEFEL